MEKVILSTVVALLLTSCVAYREGVSEIRYDNHGHDGFIVSPVQLTSTSTNYEIIADLEFHSTAGPLNKRSSVNRDGLASYATADDHFPMMIYSATVPRAMDALIKRAQKLGATALFGFRVYYGEDNSLRVTARAVKIKHPQQ